MKFWQQQHWYQHFWYWAIDELISHYHSLKVKYVPRLLVQTQSKTPNSITIKQNEATFETNNREVFTVNVTDKNTLCATGQENK